MAKMIPNMDSAIDRAHLVTADGRRVDHVESVPGAHVWRWRVTVDGVSYCVNSNGRRYSNVPSTDDVLRDWPYDAMPHMLEAIKAIESGDIVKAQRLNDRRGFSTDVDLTKIYIPHPSHLQ